MTWETILLQNIWSTALKNKLFSVLSNLVDKPIRGEGAGARRIWLPYGSHVKVVGHNEAKFKKVLVIRKVNKSIDLTFLIL